MIRANAVPRPALLLGIGGLLPFWALGLAVATGVTVGQDPGTLTRALVLYAAIILSFLGGIRWGIGVMQEEEPRATRNFLISVVPALLAWAVLLMPPGWHLPTLTVLMIALGLFDYGLVCREEAPEWFGVLRLGLAGAASVPLLAAAIWG